MAWAGDGYFGRQSHPQSSTGLTSNRIVAMIVGFCFVLIFLFVPETFWDRTPRPKSRKVTFESKHPATPIASHTTHSRNGNVSSGDGADDMRKFALSNSAAAAGGVAVAEPGTIAARRQQKNSLHAGSAPRATTKMRSDSATKAARSSAAGSATGEARPMTLSSLGIHGVATSTPMNASSNITPHPPGHYESPPPSDIYSPQSSGSAAVHDEWWRVVPSGGAPKTPGLHSFNSPFYLGVEQDGTDYLKNEHHDPEVANPSPEITSHLVDKRVDDPNSEVDYLESPAKDPKSPIKNSKSPIETSKPEPPVRYTTYLKTQPPKSFAQALKPWNGRLRHDHWLHVAFRPFILFAYPSVLWSTMVYSLSVGWLIVLSESVSHIYRDKDTYNFSALGTGLVYLSPFVGGVLGTAVAGKVSDIIVRFMSRRNGGVYEPEFRLVMALPVAISTSIGLMGFGWSAEERDRWIVPTIFFGIISFGCCLGSTTAITFCVDSYRQYAGEALVTLNFSKSAFLDMLSLPKSNLVFIVH